MYNVFIFVLEEGGYRVLLVGGPYQAKLDFG